MPLLHPRTGHLGLILPLCTTSASLGLSLLQYPLFLSFLSPKPSPFSPSHPIRIHGSPLSHFWSSFLTPAAGLIATLSLTSAVSGILSARWLRAHATLETTDVGAWYLWGAGLAAGHLLFAPMVAGPIKRVVEGMKGKEGGEVREKDVEAANEREMWRWLGWHSVRTVLVDLPALLCFAEGAALSFWVI